MRIHVLTTPVVTGDELGKLVTSIGELLGLRVRLVVGLSVTGEALGKLVGLEVTGDKLGETVGLDVVG